MADFIPVARVSEIADPGKLVVACDDRIVILFHVDGQFFCLDDICTHDGGPIGDGHLQDCEIVCRRHGSHFDIHNGKVLCMPATADIDSHEVRIEGENVLVRLRAK